MPPLCPLGCADLANTGWSPSAPGRQTPPKALPEDRFAERQRSGPFGGQYDPLA